MDNTAFGQDVPPLPQWTGPSPTMVHVQVILFASLAISLLSAFLAMLGKQWLNRYVSTDMRGSAIERSQNRQRKLDGIVAWYFDHVMESLPSMLQAALLLLGCALSRYLWNISTAVALVVIGVTSFGIVFYLSIIVAGAVYESCPYQTPGSRTLRHLGSKGWVFGRKALALGSKVWRTILSILRDIPPTLRNTFDHPPSLVAYHFIRAPIRGLFALLVGTCHLVRGAIGLMYSALQQGFARRPTPPHLRCVSWTLQTSLDKPVHLTTLKYLLTITEFTDLDLTLVMDCFYLFSGCVNLSGRKLVVMRGLEPLATVSAGCLFRTLCHLLVTDPTSSILAELRRRYTRAFPFETDFGGLPFYQTIMKTHFLAHERWNGYSLQGDDHTSFARWMVEAAQVGYQRAQPREVPQWILHLVLDSLFLDPPSPASVIADCLTIAAIDLDCVTFQKPCPWRIGLFTFHEYPHF